MVNSPSGGHSARTPGPALAAVGIGTFTMAMDGSAVNAMLPVIGPSLQASFQTMQWLLLSYTLTLTALLLPGGRLGDAWGHKRTYLAGAGLFVLGALACAFAPSAAWLITARVAQGCGTALAVAVMPALLTEAFPASQRGQALGAGGAFTYLGLMAGPTVGGLLTESFGWRSLFAVSALTGLGLTLLANRVLEPGAPPIPSMPGDGGGVRGFFALFRIRAFTMAAISSGLHYMAVFGARFMLPFYLIQGRGLAPSHAGLVLAAMPLAMAVSAPLAGRWSDRIGSRGPSSLGMFVIFAMLLSLAGLTDRTPLWGVAALLAAMGVGIGTFVSPNNSALLGAVPEDRRGVASGLVALCRNVGNAMGVWLTGMIFTMTRGAESAGGVLPGVRAALIFSAGIALCGMFTSWTRDEARLT